MTEKDAQELGTPARDRRFYIGPDAGCEVVAVVREKSGSRGESRAAYIIRCSEIGRDAWDSRNNEGREVNVYWRCRKTKEGGKIALVRRSDR